MGAAVAILTTATLASAGYGDFDGPYAPPAGHAGTTAIHRTDASFVAWATDCEVVRGLQNVADPDVNGDGTDDYATHGTPDEAIGPANASSGNPYPVVSLGDGGYATLTFDRPITNGPGFDFAVFENGFIIEENMSVDPDFWGLAFLELAYVEVSSDGTNFFRFPAVSLTPLNKQWEGIDTTYIHNLASKYKANYGTPFDLEELAGTPGLDVTRVTHVRIVDAVGSIDPAYGTQDSQGNLVNYGWPTPYGTSSMDLDAVGVLHEASDTVAVPGPIGVLIPLAGLLCLMGSRKLREKRERLPA
ncbi:MAG: hypothetical protein CR984_05270 [Proteobacteria bacterium]|nr:MAG: hypothetical protein CR984_05270 [Pseudomonadota bacterium]